MRRKVTALCLSGGLALAVTAPAFASPSPPTNGGNGGGNNQSSASQGSGNGGSNGNPNGNASGGSQSGSGGGRKDRFGVSLNSDFDLYSMGKDRSSAASLSTPPSHDDILRANDGDFVGVASDF